MTEKIILIGGGGHCRSCIDVIEAEGRFSIAGIIDAPDRRGETVLGYPVIGSDDDLPRLCGRGGKFLVTVGQIKSPDTRIRLFERIVELGGRLPSIVSPRAHVSRSARIGEGTIVMHRAVVNASGSVGANCIVNTGALLEHDVVVADHSHIATTVTLNGGVRVGARTFVGSGSVTREAIEIGSDCVIGCGLRILRSVPDGTLRTTSD